jgi:acetyl-CoA acetyltransferase family protein
MESNRFEAEIAAVTVNDRKGMARSVSQDEHPRPDSSLEVLAAMKPAFRRDGGTVTAGSSSGINDGASALLVMEESAAKARGFKPLARVVSSGVAGVSPEIMGMGPVPALRLALKRAELRVEDIDLFELNEAFASQVLACMRELAMDEARVNVNGGGIALGHPLGASGARIITTLVHEMNRRGANRGAAAMCVGVGQGTAMVLERPK